MIKIVLSFSIFFLSLNYAVAQSTLSITMTGFKNDTGQALIAVHNTKKTFLKKTEPFRHAVVPILNKVAKVSFDNLPFGTYSVSVFHDENSNMDLDAILGVFPKEDYGFSNNARAKFGPPKYKHTLFKLDKREIKNLLILIGPAVKEGTKLPEHLKTNEHRLQQSDSPRSDHKEQP